MEYVRGIILVYTGASAVACLIHMWRNRKNKEIVKMYAWTFVLELLLFVGVMM